MPWRWSLRASETQSGGSSSHMITPRISAPPIYAMSTPVSSKGKEIFNGAIVYNVSSTESPPSTPSLAQPVGSDGGPLKGDVATTGPPHHSVKRKHSQVARSTPTSIPRHSIIPPLPGVNGESTSSLDEILPAPKRMRRDSAPRASLSSSEKAPVTPSQPKPMRASAAPDEIIDATADDFDTRYKRIPLPQGPMTAPKTVDRPLRYTLEWSHQRCSLERKNNGVWTAIPQDEPVQIDFEVEIGEMPDRLLLNARHVMDPNEISDNHQQAEPARLGPWSCGDGFVKFRSTAKLDDAFLPNQLKCDFMYDLRPNGHTAIRVRRGDREIISSPIYRCRDSDVNLRVKVERGVKIIVHSPTRTEVSRTPIRLVNVSASGRNGTELSGENVTTQKPPDIDAVGSPRLINPSTHSHAPTPPLSIDSPRMQAETASAEPAASLVKEPEPISIPQRNPSLLNNTRLPTPALSTPEPASPKSPSPSEPVEPISSVSAASVPEILPLDVQGAPSEVSSDLPGMPDGLLDTSSPRYADEQQASAQTPHGLRERTRSPSLGLYIEETVPQADQCAQSPPASIRSPDHNVPASATSPILSRWTGKPSTRKDPHSRANLLPEIDKVFKGDPARTIDEDEHRIWFVREEKELTDATRFFASTWCRFVQEHGTMPFVEQEKYVEQFFKQYGPLINRAEAGRTVLQHLVRLYRNRHLHAPLYGRRDRDPESDFMQMRQRDACDMWLRLAERWNALVDDWDQVKASQLVGDGDQSQKKPGSRM